MTSLLDSLRTGGLEEFYPTLFTRGIIDVASLTKLTLQDYSGLGIVKTDDRIRLAKLIAVLKGQAETRAAQVADLPVRNAASHHPALVAEVPKPKLSINTNQKVVQDSQVLKRQLSGDQQPVPRSPGRSLSRSNSNSRPQSPFAGSPALRVERDQVSAPAPAPVHRAESLQPRASAAPVSHRPEPLQPRASAAPASHPRHNVADQESPVSNRQIDRNEQPLPLRRKNADGLMVVQSNPLVNMYGVPSTGTSSTSLMGSRVSSTNRSSPSEFTDRIRVCVRKRPLNRKELKRKESDITNILGRRNLVINEPKSKVDLTRYIEQHTFTFDEVFDETAGNDEVYRRTAKPLVEYTFTGGKATCFVYGQTGSGKTHTMMSANNGLYLLAARDMFQALKTSEHNHLVAFVSFYEIYQSQLYDLLNARNKIYAREDGKSQVCIQGLNEQKVDSVDQLMSVFELGNQSRSTGTTGANDDSSRSHAILQICLRHKQNPKRLHGKFSFIDLAGSERGADRGDADNKTRMEGSEINKSLLALKECIRALDQVSRHTPFRQSKLTQVLKDSFVGNSRTCMIATISPSSGNAENTLNTLRYADRVKEMKADTPPSTNEIPEEHETDLNDDEEAGELMVDEDVDNGDQDVYEDDDPGSDEDGSLPSSRGLDLNDEFPPDELQSLSSDDEKDALFHRGQGHGHGPTTPGGRRTGGRVQHTPSSKSIQVEAVAVTAVQPTDRSPDPPQPATPGGTIRSRFSILPLFGRQTPASPAKAVGSAAVAPAEATAAVVPKDSNTTPTKASSAAVKAIAAAAAAKPSPAVNGSPARVLKPASSSPKLRSPGSVSGILAANRPARSSPFRLAPRASAQPRTVPEPSAPLPAGLAGVASDRSPSSAGSGSDYEELIRSHRQFIRETAEIARVESRILANFTIRLNKSGGRDVVGLIGKDGTPLGGAPDRTADFETYARELDAVLDKKAEAIADFRARLQAMAAI